MSINPPETLSPADREGERETETETETQRETHTERERETERETERENTVLQQDSSPFPVSLNCMRSAYVTVCAHD